MKISEVSSRELPKLHEIAEKYLTELNNIAGETPDPEGVKSFVNRRFSLDDEGKFIFWAIVDGSPIGFAMLHIYEDGKYAFIHDFYIIPEKRQKGYGTSFIEWLRRHLEDRGIERIDLHVGLENLTAMNFWRKQGFETVQFRMREYLKNSQHRDDIP